MGKGQKDWREMWVGRNLEKKNATRGDTDEDTTTVTQFNQIDSSRCYKSIRQLASQRFVKAWHVVLSPSALRLQLQVRPATALWSVQATKLMEPEADVRTRSKRRKGAGAPPREARMTYE